MKKSIRILSLVLTVIIAIAAFSGCSSKKRKAGEPPIKTSNKTVVMTMGGYNVYYDFYKYMFLNTKYYYDNGDDTYWTKEGNDVEVIKEYIHDALKNTYAMFALADKYEITFTKDELKQIDDYVAQAKTQYGEEEYKKQLELAFLTEELFTYIIKIQELEAKVYEHIIDEKSGVLKVNDKMVEEAINKDFVRATHILLTYSNEEQKETKLKEINAILEQLKNGEDFEKIKDEKSEDTNLKGKTDGYYFTHGEFPIEFEEAAFALKEGEMSGIVNSYEGYHIIKRLPIDKDYVEEHFEDLRTQYLTYRYYELLKETYKDYTAQYKDEYKNLKVDSFN